MSLDSSFVLIDWPEALKRNATPNALWNDIVEALDAAAFEDDEDESEQPEEPESPSAWFREFDDWVSYDLYNLTALAYEELRGFLPDALRESTDAFMLPNITSLGGYHQDLGPDDVFLVSLNPESVCKYLKLAESTDFSKLRGAYDEHCPENLKEELARYAGQEDSAETFETAFKPFIDHYIDALRAAAAEERGFLYPVR